MKDEIDLVIPILGHTHTQYLHSQGLNELPTKPEFGEEWQAGKFEFQGEESAVGGASAPGAKPETKGTGTTAV